MFVFVSLNAQKTHDSNTKKNNLLNKITDITSRVREVTVKDTTKGFSAPLKIDTAYANIIHAANLEPLRDENGLLVLEPEWTPFSNDVTFRDTIIFEPIFLPVVFDGNILPSKLDFLPKDVSSSQSKDFHLISPDSTFAPILDRVEHTENMRRMYYMNNPQKVRLNALTFKGSPVIREEVVEAKNPFKELISADNAVDFNRPEIEKVQIRSVYWIKNGEHVLQLSQNNFSDNWGSDNNFNLYSNQKFTFNYKKKKVSFNNLIEWRLNLQQTPADSVNSVNIIDDYLRTYSTFSIDAFKKWSYSSNLEMKTPLLNKYKVNDVNKKKQRAIFSPFELNLGVGMRYASETTSKVDKYRKFKISADLSVLSLNYKYVGDEGVDVTMFGVEKNYKDKLDYGSTFNVNLSYNRNRYTSFTSRIKYFTNYEKIYVECENAFNFALNRYLSTTLYLYVKYDDGVPPSKKDDKWGYFMYNEMLRFGLTYTW